MSRRDDAVKAFMQAVYPGYDELAMASMSDIEALQEATRQLNDRRPVAQEEAGEEAPLICGNCGSTVEPGDYERVNAALSSTPAPSGEVRWHPWPKEKPPKPGWYLTTSDAGVRSTYFGGKLWDYQCIAWHPMIEPYSLQSPSPPQESEAGK